jgi:hypothetical protein
MGSERQVLGNQGIRYQAIRKNHLGFVEYAPGLSAPFFIQLLLYPSKYHLQSKSKGNHRSPGIFKNPGDLEIKQLLYKAHGNHA